MCSKETVASEWSTWLHKALTLLTGWYLSLISWIEFFTLFFVCCVNWEMNCLNYYANCSIETRKRSIWIWEEKPWKPSGDWMRNSQHIWSQKTRATTRKRRTLFMVFGIKSNLRETSQRTPDEIRKW